MTADSPWPSAPPDLRELLALASDLAREAGRVHADGRRGTLRIETKSSPTDLVSQVDKQAERPHRRRLRDLRPDDALLAEEGSLMEGASGVRWIVDPLDGTTNYIYGYPAFAASIGVEIDGRPAIGVVYESSAGRLYQALDGHGARCDGRPIAGERAAGPVPGARRHGLLLRGARSASARAPPPHAYWAASRDIRRGGSAALDLCHIAAGHVDAYWELDLSPWDYAAGAVIAREAGAEVGAGPRGARARAGRRGRAPRADARLPGAAARGGRAGLAVAASPVAAAAGVRD